MLTKNQILDVIKRTLAAYKTSILDKQYATIQYVDDKAIVEQIPISRVDEGNKVVYVNCNEMGTYKKYFVPNKYANVYSFSFIYTNDDSTETEIVRIGGALTRDDFVLCSRNTSSQLVLVLGNTSKYTYIKSTKTITTSLYGYLGIGNTTEYIPTHDYNPATKKYVDDVADTLVKIDTNKYKLITCDDPLVITKSDITDIADATISIDNLTGQFGNLVVNEDGTYTYTLNTIMTDVETFTFTVGEATQDLVIVPYKVMVYDDRNPAFTYSDGVTWEQKSDNNANSKTLTSTVGEYDSTNRIYLSHIQFSFKGTSATLILKLNNNCGNVLVKYFKSSNTTPSEDYPKSTTKADYKIQTITATTFIVDKANIDYIKVPYDEYNVIINVTGPSKAMGYNSEFNFDGIKIYDTLGEVIENESILKLYEIYDTYYNMDMFIAKEDLNSYLSIYNTNEYIPTLNYHPATKKYVDDSIANLPIKKVISTQENPIIISNLSDGIYDFGNTSYSKMFDSDTEILENILGICILYTVNESKKNLYVNFNKSVYDYKYELSTSDKNYVLYKYNKIITIGGSSNQPLILLDDMPLNGTFGIYHTHCSSLKLTATSEIVSLNSGPKILLINKTTLNNIYTYNINVFGAYISKKIVYKYDPSTSEATLISDNDYVLKGYVDNTITEQISSSQATDEEVNAMLQTVLGGDYSNEQ